MRLLKNGKIIDNPWIRLQEDDSLPEGNVPVLSDLKRWKSHREILLTRDAPLGIWLKSTQVPEDIAEDLTHFSVIALHFPVFVYGAHYSTARLLRERYGYKGEIRATGDVLRDQLLFLHRCGFDSFECKKENDAKAWETALQEFSQCYQPAFDQKHSVIHKRHSNDGHSH